MKRQNLLNLLTALISLISANAYSHNIEVQNSDGKTIYYNFINNNTELAVTFRGGSFSDYENEYSGDIVIPGFVVYEDVTYPVTSIVRYAFVSCSSLTSVTISNGVTSIGDGAFQLCSGLTSVTIPKSVTQIYPSAFYMCENLASLNIESGNTVYDSRDNCNAIIDTQKNELIYGTKNTVIPNSVTSIGKEAFRKCSGLTSVTIPNSVTSIGESAFRECTGLTSVTIGNSVTSIGVYAFMSCKGLTSVTIGNSVTSIGSQAFSGCSGLTSVTIPNSVTSIGHNPFSSCYNLASLNVESGNTVYDSRDNCNAIIETQKNELICGLKNTIIPNSVTSIGSQAFSGCNGLTSMTIPNSVTSIRNAAFMSCKDLTSITIPNSVTLIDQQAFQNCSGLTSVTIGNSVTSIGVYAFKDCSSLTSLTIPNSVTSIDEAAFFGCSSLTSVTIPNSVTSIGINAFLSCSSLTSMTIPNSVTSIGHQAFYGCSSLTSVAVKKETPLTIFESVFTNRANATLFVPAGCVDAYKGADYWKEFKEILEEGDAPTPTANTLSSSNVSSYKGTQVVLPILLNNEQTIAGFQFDLQLPSGISVAKSGNDYVASLTSRTSGLSVSAGALESGGYRFVVADLSKSNRVTGTEGEVMNITLDVPFDATIGEGTITLKNIALTAVVSGVNTTLYPDNVTSTLSVLGYTLGDVNDDSNINVVDVAAIAAHVAGQTPTAFTEIAADVNTDGVVNSADITVEVTNVQQAESPGTGTSAGALLNASDFAAYKGVSVILPITLTNSQAITGFQFDLQLPEGVSIAQNGISLASRANGLTVNTSTLASNTTRIVVVATDGSTMAAGEGEIMNITIAIAENATNGTVTLKNIIIAAKNDNDLSAVYADDVTATVTAKSFTLGDVNNDDHINVTDVVCVVDDIMGNTPANFVRIAADIDGNGEVNVKDVTDLVDIILRAQGKAATRGFAKENVVEIDGLELKKDNNGQLSLCVKDVRNYVASQMEIRLDEGQTLEGITLNDNFKQTHQLIFARSGHSSYTVLVFSMTNESYPLGDDELLKLNVSGGAGEIVVQEAMMVTREQDQKRMAPVSSYQAETGTELMDIYSLDGRLVKAQAKDTNGLTKGVYIIDGKKVIVK